MRGTAAALMLLLSACADVDPARRPAPSVVGTCARAGPSTSAFELIVLGSGGPHSTGRAASSQVLLVDGVPRVLVDVGPGAFVRLGELGLDLHRLDLVLLTHLHIDHSGDLPGFVKSRDLGEGGPLTFHIFGPGGRGAYPSTSDFVDRLFGAQGAFPYLPGFRNALRLEAVNLPFQPEAPIHEILRESDLRVSSVAVDHDDVPAVAYRIEHAGHAVVVSGDLASRDDNLVALAAGADLLVYDAAVLDPPGSPANLYEFHTPPHRIGEVAAKARVRALLLSHLTPTVEGAEGEVLQSVRGAYAGPAHFARDCLRLDVGTP